MKPLKFFVQIEPAAEWNPFVSVDPERFLARQLGRAAAISYGLMAKEGPPPVITVIQEERLEDDHAAVA